MLKHRYIVVEGSIACGKSALSERLAEYFGATLFPEKPEENPFLSHFYSNVTQHALATQLAFLMKRAEDSELILSADKEGKRVVSDFLLEKDQIFVPVILDDEEAKLYWNIKQKIMPHYPAPDLVIYLQASDEVVANRVHKRGHVYKSLFPEGYLTHIHAEYRRFFHAYNHAPLLIANTDELDFAGNDDHFALLIDALMNMQGGVHYLNLNTYA